MISSPELQSKVCSDNKPSYEITPSPILGNAGKSITSLGPQSSKSLANKKMTTGKMSSLPIISKTDKNSKPTPSPILGKIRKFHYLQQSLKTKSTHDLSCGCNDCFNFQLNSMKQVTVKTISNLIDNFIKYKAKKRLGKLEDHVDDCMCVELEDSQIT